MTENQKLREAHDYKQANGSMNCMQCVAAYMLGFPVEMVPDFALHADATLAWDAFHAFFKAHGYAALMLPSTHAPESDYLASGSTSRGTKHIVVMNDGELVFDPHPSNAGLSKIDCIYVIARQALALPTGSAHADTWGISRAMVTLYAYECDGLTGDALALQAADHLPDAGNMVVDHFPDATKMIETAVPVGERLTLSAEDVHAAFVKHFPKTRLSQAWIGFAAEIANAVAARAAPSAGDAVDAQRLDFLDALCSRPASSDMHMRNGSVALYVRTGIGAQLAAQGHGKVRDAIDAAMRKDKT